jgi:TolA-binding protein
MVNAADLMLARGEKIDARYLLNKVVERFGDSDHAAKAREKLGKL